MGKRNPDPLQGKNSDKTTLERKADKNGLSRPKLSTEAGVPALPLQKLDTRKSKRIEQSACCEPSQQVYSEVPW